jgi:hypothetical protein
VPLGEDIRDTSRDLDVNDLDGVRRVSESAAKAYRRVIAARFSERALFCRLSTGLREVDRPMAAVSVMMLPARVAGIM